MKPSVESTKPPLAQPPTSAGVAVPKAYRRLRWNELVLQGDFVGDEQTGWKLWDGPSGFQADSFVRPIYRRDEGGKEAGKSL